MDNPFESIQDQIGDYGARLLDARMKIENDKINNWWRENFPNWRLEINNDGQCISSATAYKTQPNGNIKEVRFCDQDDARDYGKSGRCEPLADYFTLLDQSDFLVRFGCSLGTTKSRPTYDFEKVNP